VSLPNCPLILFFSLSSLGAGLFLASAHPVAPFLITAIFLGIFLFFLCQPRFALVSLPVFLPLLNFSPWTGWLIVDEFDLLVLAVVAAGYLRLPADGSRRQLGLVFLLLVIVVLLVTQGANGVRFQDLDWFSDYTSPLNSLRVGKSLLWVVLLFPLVVQAGMVASASKATTEFFGACLLGSCWVVLAVIWERVFFPGLIDLSTPYRTVALFWEMHLGGAALDAYLVLIAPLLVWVWRATVFLPGRLAIGTFILVFVYVCLTTFSRGVFGAMVGSMLVLTALLVWHRVKVGSGKPAFRPTGFIVLFLVALEIMLVLGADSFMNKRLAVSERDLGGRLQHWGQGIGLLKTPSEWLFGIGLGKLPARLTQGESGLVLPGSFHWHEDNGQRSMAITGPDVKNRDRELGGLYALSQRVDLIPRQRYRFAMDVRNEHDVEMLVHVCALHLLYPASCQGRKIRLNSGGWQRWESRLSGYPFKTNSWLGAGHGVLLLSVVSPGTEVEVANLNLTAGGGNLIRNAQFLEEGAGWFPVARSYFLPWHIDNLYLEFLIEKGLIGLIFFLAVVLLIFWRLFRAYLLGNALAPYFLSCIAGVMALGLVVSVLDMPRVATLFGLFLVWAWQGSELSVGRIRPAI
jgi:hypothetical protein